MIKPKNISRAALKVQKINHIKQSSAYCTYCLDIKFLFPRRRSSISKCSSVSLFLRGVMTCPKMLSRRSTSALDGRSVFTSSRVRFCNDSVLQKLPFYYYCLLRRDSSQISFNSQSSRLAAAYFWSPFQVGVGMQMYLSSEMPASQNYRRLSQPLLRDKWVEELFHR